MPTSQRDAARRFAASWKDKGYEKGQSQSFWLELLQSVYGVQDPFSFITFEGQIKNRSKTSFMDAYIPSTKVLIEQKSIDKDLNKPIPQSDGSMLTPYEQAKKYVVDMPVSKHPRWVVTCNFREFCIYDMENPLDEPEVVLLANLEREYYRLSFLVENSAIHTRKEEELSMAAGRIIGEIYDAFLKEYINPSDPDSLRSLNILCVRLVFCLYAEDAGLFDGHSMFHDYLSQFKPGTGDMRKALLDLFEVLNTPLEKRDPYLRDDLMAFPYVSGGLFTDTDIEVPRFNDKIASLLLKHASGNFDWSHISPTIFGGVFESTLNPETRRKGGMHYTSVENIHKVIDPLFLNDLRAELADIKAEPSERKRISRAQEFQNKLAGLQFLDPACGSGNFLTESYLNLRRLENEALRIIYKGQMVMGDILNPIKVSIGQFHGIEINDFAVSVAMTALWIAEAQMLFETERIMQISLEFLPLKSYTNIREGNALILDWNTVVQATELNYIMGNPPFIGARMMAQGSEQKKEVENLFGNVKDVQDLDYVCCWFRKAAEMIQGTNVHVGFVATNSICQGAQVPILWDVLLNTFHTHIDYAYQTFKWENEAIDRAAVHCVIIGFSISLSSKKRQLFLSDGSKKIVENISPYLVDGPSVFVVSKKTPICPVPQMNFGNQPRDGGFFIFTDEEKAELEKTDSKAAAWLRPYYGAVEFIQRKSRWCLWLLNASPGDIRASRVLYERVESVKQFRLSSSAKTTNGYAKVPHLFAQITQPDGVDCLLIPSVSSEKRFYIPIGFIPAGVIASNAVQIVPNATLYHFGILTSSTHNAWVRAVCGRLKSDYRYSKEIVYNTFPWPTPSEALRRKIEQTAQGILDARALYPDSSLADLYDDLTMPAELRKAHKANDAAVLEAYGFLKDASETEIVAQLFRMYQTITEG